MYTNIQSIDENISFLNTERDRNDTVFNTKSMPTRYETDSLINNDKDYNSPDRKQYIFSTMGMGLNVIYSNNMVTPVRTKSTLNGYHMYSEIAKYIKKKHIDNGVYIIDYYTLHNDGTTDIESVLNYYINNSTINYDNETVQNIVDTLTNNPGKTYPTKIKIT